ncbi:MAG: hypothetical protein R3288_04205 [Woeseiaceae bacterium]|nr:hypothetical protein [Woeseiaceae bacterium]
MLAALALITAPVIACARNDTGRLPDDGIAARAFGVSVEWASLQDAKTPAQGFARYLDERLMAELAGRLDIDMSDAAARDYVEKLTGAPAADEQLQRDQQVAADIADALERVLIDRQDAATVYRDSGISGLMDEAQWLEYLRSSGPDHISTLRTFAGSGTPTAADSKESMRSLRAVYFKFALRDAVCSTPQHFLAIRKRMLEMAGGDTADPLLKSISVFEFECAVEVNDYVGALLDREVEILRPELNGYRQHLQAIDHNVEMRRSSGPP